MKKYSVLLYYCYTNIDDPEKFSVEHHLFCLSLKLRGRIIIANEGINGTVSGLKVQCGEYMHFFKSDLRFKNIEFKIDENKDHAFKKLKVHLKPELVTLGLHTLDPNKKTGEYLEPAEFKRMMVQEETVVLDMRNNVEHNIGKFKNAVTLNIDHFRDFTSKVKELERYKNYKILMYCTGGVRCEKASAYLLQQGFKDVYQLHGGIINYGNKAGGKDFDGSCYVFDSRIAVDVNKVNPVVISRCYICGSTCDRMVNCANPECNLHLPICKKCGLTYEGACSKECMAHPKKRPLRESGYYQKEMNGYDPYYQIKK